jgi:putative transposase
MPRRARRNTSAPFFHVTNRTAHKHAIFLRANDYRAFLKVLAEGLRRYPVRLFCFCVLSNHWHLVVGPIDTKALTYFMRWVAATHASRWRRHHHSVGLGPVYQGRFHAEAIEEPGHLVRVCRYVERNALSAGLVARAQDWPWCSLAERLRRDPSIPLESTPYLCSDSWIEYVNSVLHTRDEVRLRQQRERRGQPAESTSVPKSSKPVEKSSVPIS